MLHTPFHFQGALELVSYTLCAVGKPFTVYYK